MRKLSTAFLIAGVVVVAALAGCGGGGGGGTPTPPPSTTFTVTGKVVDSASGNGVGGVIIKFGTANLTTATASNGTFSIDTGVASAAVAYAGWVGTKTFTVSTENMPQPNSGSPTSSIYPTSFSVLYGFYTGTNDYYSQSAVTVPAEVLGGSKSSLGTIKVLNYDQIPPPPGF